MKIAIISDTHNLHHQCPMDKIEGSDLLIHCGDFCGQGTKGEAICFMDWFSQIQKDGIVKEAVFIAGNHDCIFELQPESLKSFMPSNVHYLEDSGVELFGYKIWGSPVTPFFFNWAFNRHRGTEISEHWDLIPEDTDILITHGPPYGIMDVAIYDQEAVGCHSLLSHVWNRLNLKLHCFGHIHHWTGIEEHNGTTFVNASQVTEQYQYLKEPVIITLEDKA